jgi:iron complex transport system substrate-binding protein
VLPVERMSQHEIDRAVTERMRNGLSLYQVDEGLIRAIAPDLILTQDLCQVCAPSGNEVAQLLQALPSKPQVLWMTPKCIEQIFDNLRQLGEATDRSRKAEQLIILSRARLESIASVTRKFSSVHACSAWSGWTRFTAAAIGCQRWWRLPVVRTSLGL